MDPVAFYLEDIYLKTKGYRATWFPGKPLKLGQIIKIDREGSINSFQGPDYWPQNGITIEYDESRDPGAFDLTSENGVTVTAMVKGQVKPQEVQLLESDAGFVVEFVTENSYVFRLLDYTIKALSNLAEIQKLVLRKYKEDDWDADYRIVSEIIEARSSTILISGEKAKTIGLKVSGAAKIATMDIADAALNLSWASGQSLANSVLATSSTPLYKVVGLNTSLLSKIFGKQKIVSKNIGEAQDMPPLLEIVNRPDLEEKLAAAD